MAKATVETIPADEIAEIVAAADSDVAKSGRSETILETNTVVEDRTEKPVVDIDREYHSEDIDLGNGTILTNIGEPKDAA
jgi:hypothetical protein